MLLEKIKRTIVTQDASGGAVGPPALCSFRCFSSSRLAGWIGGGLVFRVLCLVIGKKYERSDTIRNTKHETRNTPPNKKAAGVPRVGRAPLLGNRFLSKRDFASEP
jgi:hypothetical protein